MALTSTFTKHGITYNEAYIRVESIKIWKTRKDAANEGDVVVNKPIMSVLFAIYPNKLYSENYNINDSLHSESIPLICDEGRNYHEQAYEFIKLNKTYLFDSPITESE